MNRTFFKHLCQQHIEFETENFCELLENSNEEIFNLATQIQDISVPSTSNYFELFLLVLLLGLYALFYAQVYFVYPVLHLHVYTAIPKGQNNETLRL